MISAGLGRRERTPEFLILFLLKSRYSRLNPSFKEK
jgi:hypothetical protein